ncbi:MAG: dihydrolipoyl dehydrogenase [Accumulibacter sp.]|jgi:dihydrolipoamide dehydrogenase|uniref:dihydrolipoyl dehydrogenase n=1 Tax=Accumulibacter sp. TaxID=2053492 RepID=UPI002FC2F191
MKPEIRTDVAIIGAGSAGLYAMREVRQAGRSFVLIDHGPLGTTCARVGCMPSKVALHAGRLWAARKEIAGVDGLDALSLDTARLWAALREQRDQFASRPEKAARSMAGDFLLEGPARFREAGVLEVSLGENVQIVRAGAVVIATGSRPVVPAWLATVAERTLTTEQLFELPVLPKRVGVLGLGAIGLEMGLALSRLGVEVIGADVANTVAGIVDPVIGERAVGRFMREITIWLGREVSVSTSGDEVLMCSGERVARVDLLLAALGRRPNVDGLNLAAAGIEVDGRGLPKFDPATMQIGALPVFIAGDATGDRPLMHEAADEGAIAGYNAARSDITRFRRKVPLGMAFSDPDVAAVGARLDQLDAQSIVIGSAGGDSNGRARILGGEDSLLRVYADARDGKLLGAAMVATGGEHIAHLLAWAIQRGETAQSLLQLPFYHPVVEELLQTALKEIAEMFSDGLPVGLVRT